MQTISGYKNMQNSKGNTNFLRSGNGLKLVCVTNRRLCPEPFSVRMEKLAAARPDAILLREKDLSLSEYTLMAALCQKICQAYHVPLILHTHLEAAKTLNSPFLHLPLPLLARHSRELNSFLQIGTSVHSLTEAMEAQALGATYLIAGHIFPTSCKENLPPRGLDFLEQICSKVALPVLGIGGITPEQMPALHQAKSAGACVMSPMMIAPDPKALCALYRRHQLT